MSSCLASTLSSWIPPPQMREQQGITIIIIVFIIITTRMVVIDAFRYSGRAVGVQLAAHIRTQVLSFQSLQQPVIANSSCKMSRTQPCRKLPCWSKITHSCSKSSSLYFGGNQHRLAGLPSLVSTFSSLLPTSSTSALLSRIRRNQFKMAILVNIWKSCEIQVWGKLLQAAGKSPHRFSPPTRASYSGGSPWCHRPR